MIGERHSDPELQAALGWIGSRIDDVYGMTIGKVVDVWIDDWSGKPRWLLVQGGRFGGHYTLVPYEGASGGSEDVWVPYDIGTVRQAPTVVPGKPLDSELDARLEAHYAVAREKATPTPPPLPPATPRGEHAHRLG